MQGLILYHDPGSGGDFLTSILQNTGQFYASREFKGADATGKVTPGPTKPKVQKLFPDPDNITNLNLWADRDWSDWDEVKMKSLTDKIWILSIMQPRSIKQLREKGCDWPILKISYQRNMYWFIKKCILKKLMRRPHWPSCENPYDNYMLNKEKLAPWMLKKHLQNPKRVDLLMRRAKRKFWKKNPSRWNIPVDNLLANDFSPLVDFDPIGFDQKMISKWLSLQEPMFVKRPKLPKPIEKLFGYNSCLEPTDWACPLDEYDNMVINFYYPDAPTLNNTQELNSYF